MKIAAADKEADDAEQPQRRRLVATLDVRAGCRSFTAARNISRYTIRYTCVVITLRIQNALETARDQRVEQGDHGRDRALHDEDVDRDPVLVLVLEERRQEPLAPRDQQQALRRPASQVSIPPAEAQTSAIATIGTSPCRPKHAKNASKACITPRSG